MLSARRRLLIWGASHRREFPWRQTRDPWHILVSEVMLQQTQTQRVVGPFGEFTKRFPTPAACAAAPLAEVLRAWSGLGYNRRARNLHRAANQVVQHHGGVLPGDLDGLLELPGVGQYTARAVLSFAFGADVGAVDTNAGRLLSRGLAGHPLGPRQSQDLADALVQKGRSWELNQTVFDLGATVCTRRRPRCSQCPLQTVCTWAQSGWSDPDPAHTTAFSTRPQSPFAGSDRQGRGRLVAALRTGPVAEDAVAELAGWGDDPARAARILQDLVGEGLIRRCPGGRLELG